MPTGVSQNARRAMNAIEALEALYAGLLNSTNDRQKTGGSLLHDLRDAIEEVDQILNRITAGTRGTVRDRLSQESESKSRAQEQRYAAGPKCD